MKTEIIYCCGCEDEVVAILVDGRMVYPHRPDLYSLPFWLCNTCGNFVGCHYKTANRTKPLGVIPTPEIKAARGRIHKLLDPIWRDERNGISRRKLYGMISDQIGKKYHTADIRSAEEARNVYKVIKNILLDL